MNAPAPLGQLAEVLTVLDGVEVLRSPHMRPKTVQRLLEGEYETPERKLGLKAVPEGARILEMGAGAGIVGAIIARNCKPAAMMSIEANPRLLPEIRSLYDHNGLGGVIELRNCLVMAGPDTPESMTFNVSKHFLGSGLHLVQEKTLWAVEVPVTRYDTLKREFPHDVIIMDIEGAELDFLTHADLSGVKVVVVEMHRKIYGGDGMRACRKALRKAGFDQPEGMAEGGVSAWVRVRGA